MARFTGTIDELCSVDVSELVKWMTPIPVKEWLKMADASFRGWGEIFRPLATDLTERFYPGCMVSGVGIFVLEPGQVHPAHRDEQPEEWVSRVHVPIFSNENATATMDDGEHAMEVGKAYRFNTLATHAVANGGASFRAHFVFDIHQSVRT